MKLQDANHHRLRLVSAGSRSSFVVELARGCQSGTSVEMWGGHKRLAKKARDGPCAEAAPRPTCPGVVAGLRVMFGS